MNYFTRLVCSRCGREFSPDHVGGCAPGCGPLQAEYDFAAIRNKWKKQSLVGRDASMWRYAEVLPAAPGDEVSLGEGWTPMFRALRLGKELGLADLWIKDEGLNPTGSFKARGMSCAVTMAKRAGIRDLAIGSAGNAAGALAAYAAAGGLKAHVFMPRDVPQANFVECAACGADVSLVDGLIGDCVRLASEGVAKLGWYDASTFREPYRLEGKKTMGYEIAEQFGWEIPDAILYPCGGGVGLLGIWKAVGEMEQLGWSNGKRPKMIAVQAEGCRPIVRAFEEGAAESAAPPAPHTVAAGLRVPKPSADFLILRVLRESKGAAVSVSDLEIIDGGLKLASAEGIFAAPEGGACVAAIPKLLQAGVIFPAERVVILNTGSGLKYLDAYAKRFPRGGAGEQDKLGGLITPR
jgi:threonine synthase